jgi:hypothetical protein
MHKYKLFHIEDEYSSEKEFIARFQSEYGSTYITSRVLQVGEIKYKPLMYSNIDGEVHIFAKETTKDYDIMQII